MFVYKFGGASIKSADAVRNLADIVRQCKNQLLVVVSAMGKTTNALEEVVDLYFNKKQGVVNAVRKVKDYHLFILKDLFSDPLHIVYIKVNKLFNELEQKIKTEPGQDYDFDYDQIVCFGELISTTIVADYLCEEGINTKWIDIRSSLKSDNTFREAKIDWELSGKFVRNEFSV